MIVFFIILYIIDGIINLKIRISMQSSPQAQLNLKLKENNNRMQQNSANEQVQDRCSEAIEIEQQLIGTLLSFYDGIRNPDRQRISQLQKQFAQCQKKVMRVVEFRKQLQKEVEIDTIRKDHHDQLSKYLQRYQQYEDTINRFALYCREKDDYLLQATIQLARMKQNQNTKNKQKQQMRKMQRMQDNLRQVKNSFITMTQQLKKQKEQPSNFNSTGKQIVQQIQHSITVRDHIRSKQRILQAKAKHMRLRQQIMQQSQSYYSKYHHSLRQSVALYQELLKKKSQQQNNDKNKNKTKLETVQNQYKQVSLRQLEYYQITSKQVRQYESQLLKMSQLADRNQTQIAAKQLKIRQLEHKLQQFQKNIKNQQDRNNQIRYQIEQKHISTIKQKQYKIKQQQAEIKRLSYFEQQVEQFPQISRKFELKLAKYEEDDSKLRATIQSLNSKIGELITRQKGLLQLVKQLEDRCQKKETQINTMKLNSLSQSKSEQIRTNQLEARCKNLVLQLNQKEDKIKQLAQQLQKQKRQASDSNKKIKDLNQQIKQANLKTSVIQFVSQRKLSQKQNHIEQLNKRIEDLQDQYIEMQERYEQKIAQQRNQNLDKISINTSQFPELKEKLEEQLKNQWQQSSKEFEHIISQIYNIIQVSKSTTISQ